MKKLLLFYLLVRYCTATAMAPDDAAKSSNTIAYECGTAVTGPEGMVSSDDESSSGSESSIGRFSSSDEELEARCKKYDQNTAKNLEKIRITYNQFLPYMELLAAHLATEKKRKAPEHSSPLPSKKLCSGE